MLVVFGFGLIIGSFLNVVIYRYNTGQSIVSGRSACGVCGKKLLWYELVPVLSFVFQRGRCRDCGTRVSWQYPVVELATALLFTGAFYMHGLSGLFVVDAAVFSLLIVIFVYDLKHKIIPNGCVYPFIGLALAVVLTRFVFGESRHLIAYDLAAGVLIAGFFFILWAVSRGRWLGFGDVKLALGIGWFLGLAKGVSAIIIGFWLGAIVGVILIALSRMHTLTIGGVSLTFSRKSELPFAPFLIIGLIIAYFFGIDVLQLHLFLA